MGRFARTAKKKTSTKSGLPGPGIIVIPAGEWMWSLSVSAIHTLQTPPGTHLALVRGGGTPGVKRDSVIKWGLADPSKEWFFFLDSDMTPERKTLLKLLSLDAPIAGALCYSRGAPFAPIVNLLPGPDQDLRSGPFEVAWTGGAALLVRREVLEALSPGPWFPYDHGQPAGEDINFCKLARAAGFRILIDPDVRVGHVATIPVDQEVAISLSGWDGGGVSLGDPWSMTRIVVPGRNETPQPAGAGSE